MPVIKISSEGELAAVLEKGKGRLLVIDFTAKWCGPCQKIAPVYEALSEKYRGAIFTKVDVDECSELAASHAVRAMPTFLFLKSGGSGVSGVSGGNEVGRLQGADPSALQRKIEELGGAEGTEPFGGQGQRLGAQPIAPSQPPPPPNKDLELESQTRIQLDHSQPITKISIRLADGSKLTVKLNLTEKVSKIRDFISVARPDQLSKSYSLLTTFPTREIEDESLSIQESKLQNALVQQKLK